MVENKPDGKTAMLPWLLLLPTLIILSVFVLGPAIYSIILSFFEVAPFTGEMFFIGLLNYLELVRSYEYLQSLLKSLLFLLFTVPFSVSISFFLALLLTSHPYFNGFFRTVFLLPVGISSAMAGMIWIFLFNPASGYLNYLLDLVGISGPAWLSDPFWALVAVSLTTVWKEVGFNTIFFIAGLSSLPKDVEEAAIIDGAGFGKRLRFIIIPLVRPTIFFVIIISVIHALESFGQIHILTRGGPADATNVLVYSLYREAFEYFRAGFASAQAVLLFLIVLLLTWLQFRLNAKRVSRS